MGSEKSQVVKEGSIKIGDGVAQFPRSSLSLRHISQLQWGSKKRSRIPEVVAGIFTALSAIFTLVAFGDRTSSSGPVFLVVTVVLGIACLVLFKRPSKMYGLAIELDSGSAVWISSAESKFINDTKQAFEEAIDHPDLVSATINIDQKKVFHNSINVENSSVGGNIENKAVQAPAFAEIKS